MKKLMIMMLLFLAMNAVYAQKGNFKNVPPAERADKAAKHLTKVLALTPVQAEKVKTAVINRVTEMYALRDKNMTDKKAFHAEAKKIKATWESELSNIISPEQMQKYTAMKAEIKSKHKANKQTQGAAPANTDAYDMY